MQAKTTQLIRLFFQKQPPLHINHTAFPISHWPIVMLRVIAALYMTTLYCTNVIEYRDSVFMNFMYLTRNGYFYSWLYFVLICQYEILINTLYKKYSRHIIDNYKHIEESQPSQSQITVTQKNYIIYSNIVYLEFACQAIYQIAISLQLTITALYWIVLFQGNQSGYILFSDISYHAVPMVFLSLDFIVNPYRFLSRQFIFVIITGLLYMFAINLPYTLLVGPIYNVITWTDIMSYIYIVLAFCSSFLMYLLGRLIYSKLKQGLIQAKAQKHMKKNGSLKKQFLY